MRGRDEETEWREAARERKAAFGRTEKCRGLTDPVAPLSAWG